MIVEARDLKAGDYYLIDETLFRIDRKKFRRDGRIDLQITCIDDAETFFATVVEYQQVEVVDIQ